VLHGSLPTNPFRGSHHLATNRFFHMRGASVENDVHILRDNLAEWQYENTFILLILIVFTWSIFGFG